MRTEDHYGKKRDIDRQSPSNSSATIPIPIQHLHTDPSYESVCHERNVTVTDEECSHFAKTESKEKLRQFPLHYVSGIPGSGNDWILWLASINSEYN